MCQGSQEAEEEVEWGEKTTAVEVGSSQGSSSQVLHVALIAGGRLMAPILSVFFIPLRTSELFFFLINQL